MFEQLLSVSKDGIVKDLMAKIGLDADQAGQFLQRGLSLLKGSVKSGTLNSASFLQGTVSSILPKLNLGPLTELVGGDATKARTGMERILTPVMDGIKKNPAAAEGLLAQLTGARSEGIGAKVAGMAGKIFGKH